MPAEAGRAGDGPPAVPPGFTCPQQMAAVHDGSGVVLGF